jgi:hypothetical protein
MNDRFVYVVFYTIPGETPTFGEYEAKYETPMSRGKLDTMKATLRHTVHPSAQMTGMVLIASPDDLNYLG